MNLRTRIILSTIIAGSLPSLAYAQEPQPWTNTSAIGDRVVPALPVRRSEQIVIRADGGMGATHDFRLSPDRDDPGRGPSTSATFLAGRTGLSFGWQSFDVFVTSAAYKVTIPELVDNPLTGPLAISPFLQSGDAAIGARWTTGIGRSLHAGLEAGAVLIGATDSPGSEASVPLSGPNFAATSPFARGLLTWQGGGSARAEEPPITASLNVGVFDDRSWNVWEKTVEDSRRDDVISEDGPLEEERVAMNIYGDGGPETRILYGASLAYQVARVRPFVELTAESTADDLTMRVTPGLALRPLGGDRPLELFVSADVALGDPEAYEASPRGPAVRANAGLQFAFGSRPRSGPTRTRPTPTPTPPSRRGFAISMKVIDERGAPVPNARVRVFSSSTLETLLGEENTNTNGTVTVTTPPATQAMMNVIVSVRHPDCVEWVPVSVPTRASPSPTLTCYRQKTRVSVLFFDRGNPWTPPPGVDVLLTPTAPALRTGKVFGLQQPIDVPANETFRRWNIAISIPDYPKVTTFVEEMPPPTHVVRIYVDSEERCADTIEAKCARVAVVPTPTPTVALERFAFAIFDVDSVDVKEAAAAGLLQKLLASKPSPQTHKVTVQAKKGDPLFQAALAAARRDALLAWLNGKGVEVNNVRFLTTHEATSDAVLLEVPK